MYKRITLILTMILLVSGAAAQTPSSLQQVDRQTFEYWQAKNWDELIRTGREALSGGIDFFYLRYRMGIAWYEKGNYHLAIRHLERAYNIDPGNLLLAEYLYYAYLFAGRTIDAYVIANNFNQALQRKTGSGRPSGIKRLDISANMNSVASDNVIRNYSPGAESMPDGSISISRGHSFLSLGLFHQIAPKYWLYHAYSGMIKSGYFHITDPETIFINDNSRTYLNQYYMALVHHLSRKLKLSAGLHYINISYPVETLRFSRGRVYTGTVPRFEHDFLAFGAVATNLTGVTASYALILGNIGNRTQLQQDLSLTLYPFGNTDLYTHSVLSHHNGTHDGIRADRFIYRQHAGLKLLRFMWVEGSVTTGDLQNYTAYDGLVVYNSLDIITDVYSGKVNLQASGSWQIRMEYSSTAYESNYRFDTVTPVPVNQVSSVSYRGHSLTIGLSKSF